MLGECVGRGSHELLQQQPQVFCTTRDVKSPTGYILDVGASFPLTKEKCSA